MLSFLPHWLLQSSPKWVGKGLPPSLVVHRKGWGFLGSWAKGPRLKDGVGGKARKHHLETQQCDFLSNSASHPQRNDFLLVSIMRHNPIWSISAVLLSLEPSRGDGWLAIIVNAGALSFVFRHFNSSISFRWQLSAHWHYKSVFKMCECLVGFVATHFQSRSLLYLGRLVLTPQRSLLPRVSEGAQSMSFGF